MGRFLTFFALFLTFSNVVAQDSSQLIALKLNTIELRDNGGLGFGNKPGMEFPAGSKHYALNRLDFWVTGISASGDTIAAVSNPFTKQSTWVEGPTNALRQHPANWTSFHNMTTSMANTHKQDYKKSGYIMPPAIKNWPASYKNPGFPSLLAPFSDVNANGEYNPELGDYPFVPGNRQWLTLSSDSLSRQFTGQNSQGLELSVMWFTPEKEDSFPGTLLYRTTLCNRGSQAIQKVSVSAVADFGIGDASDDFMATDVKHNAILGFNGPGSDNVYGTSWPGVAVGWLSEPAMHSIYFLNTTDAPHGKPVYKGDYFLLSKGYWKTAAPLSFGNSGLDGSPVASFVYSNGSDPSVGFADWDEPAGNAGRQTALISVGTLTLQAGACHVVDGHVTIIPNAPDSAAFSQYLEKVSNYYQGTDFSLGFAKRIVSTKVEFYPNPVQASAIVNVDGLSPLDAFGIYSMTGVLLTQNEKGVNQCAAPKFPGIYIVKCTNGGTALLLVQ